MSQDLLEYAAMLSALEARRKLLNTRVDSINVAIQNVKALLEMEPDGAVGGPMPNQLTQNRRDLKAMVPASVNPAIAAQQRKAPGLNIYVNQYPEWSREMARGNVHFRKKAGLRCPKCGSSDTRKSVTEGIGRLLAIIFGYTNARCRNCKSRFRFRKEAAPRYGRIEPIQVK